MKLRIRVNPEPNRKAEGMFVYCPKKRERVWLDHCVACEHCHGLTVDATGRNSFLMCDVDIDDAWMRPLPKVDADEPLSPASRTPISKILRGKPATITSSASIESLITLFLEENLYGVPVVDDEGLPLGIISKSDLIRERYFEGETREWTKEQLRDQAHIDIDLSQGYHSQELTRATVGEMMTPIVFCLPDDATISQAAALMADEGVHQVPVLGAEGKVIGLINALDILKWIARNDGLLR